MNLPKSWNILNSEEMLNYVWKQSYEKPVAIFKHSTRCGTSLHALSNLTRDWSISEAQMQVYYLDLINYRSISNEIAVRTKVQHQSPQLIVLRNGKVIYSASHLGIQYHKVLEIARQDINQPTE